MLHPLYDHLPDTVSVQGKPYPVVTGYREWLSFLEMLADETYTAEERMLCAMAWYQAHPPCSIAEAYQALLRYVSCVDIPHTGRETGKSANAQLLSYTYDGAYIISDFLRFYHIDLTAENLHWYKFRLLLEALPDESAVKQRVAYRSIQLANVKDKNQQKRIRKVKDSLWIPTNKKLDAGQVGAIFG
ncbi:Gp15 family bacteriophage protein [Ruminococcus sp.]|uniref:Gp15 family bacteriophage protein n=1 Tax=Ruminococcus sp. TaxID=41978 RepID=UPI0025E9473A|nr:Gp15 family bacteriophage protein [Ruminococcus sp.]